MLIAEKKDKMAKLKITQVKSKIGSTKRRKATLEALGLRKINSTVEVEDHPTILGMVEKVRHLIAIENV
jgi:large subunit ribosomal protein L30